MSTEPRRANPLKTWLLRLVLSGLLALVVFYCLAACTPLPLGLVGAYLQRQLSAEGWQVTIEEVSGHLFEPIHLRGVRIEGKTGTLISVRHATARLSVWKFLFDRANGFVSSLDLDGISLIHPKREWTERLPQWIVRPWLPATLRISDGTFDICTGEGTRFSGTGLGLSTSAKQTGWFHLRQAAIESALVRHRFSPLAGKAGWNESAFYISEVKIAANTTVQSLVLDFGGLRKRRVDSFLLLTANRGTIRADTAFQSHRDSPFLDLSLAFWDIDTKELAALADTPQPARGTIREGKLTFRGSPSRPSKGEWQLRLRVDQFAWGDRQFKSLEIGGSAKAGELDLSEFLLDQGSNALSLHGTLSLPESLARWRDIQATMDINARLDDIASFSSLFPTTTLQAAGKGAVNGTVSLSKEGWRGRVDVGGSNLEFKKVPVGNLRLGLELSGDEVEIREATTKNGEDSMSASGTVSLKGDNRYKGQVAVHVQEIARYAPLLSLPPEQQISGSVQIDWSGDGTRSLNSGAFDIRCSRFRLTIPPWGLTLPLDGRFEGTYSPESTAFRRFELAQGQTQLQASVAASTRSFSMEHLSVSHGTAKWMEGSLWLPLDVVAAWRARTATTIIDANGKVYAELKAQKLDVHELAKLSGREWPINGTLSFALSAEGTPAALAAKGTLSAEKLQADSPALPPTSLTLDFSIDESLARIKGKFANASAKAVDIQGVFPVQFRQAIIRGGAWIQQAAPIDASFTATGIDLALPANLLAIPFLKGGECAGQLRVAGTYAQPRLAGEFGVEKGSLALSDLFPSVTNLQGKLLVSDEKITLDNFHGTSENAPVSLAGTVTTGNKADDTTLDISLQGSDLPYFFPPLAVRGKATFDLRVAGPLPSATLSGFLAIGSARMKKDPVLLGAPPAQQPATGILPPGAPSLAELRPNWKLDIALRATDAIPLGRRGDAGFAYPNLHIGGTTAGPVLTGSVLFPLLRMGTPSGDLVLTQSVVRMNGTDAELAGSGLLTKGEKSAAATLVGTSLGHGFLGTLTLIKDGQAPAKISLQPNGPKRDADLELDIPLPNLDSPRDSETPSILFWN